MNRIALLTMTVLLAAPPPAGAQEEPATGVDSVTASLAGTNIAVSGAASFVDVPVQVGDDAAGDPTLKGIGMDIVTATISRPDNNTRLTFSFTIGDLPPMQDGTPAVPHYNWGIGVSGTDGSFSEFQVQTFMSADGTAIFRLLRANADGSCCTVVTTLTGTMQKGAVSVQVPLNRINASPGSFIGSGFAGLLSTVGASGVVWLTNVGGDTVGLEDYIVPGRQVRVGIAPAGTPLESVSLTATATVQSSGSFSGLVAAPATAGDYVVVARACYGDGNCGLASTNITI